MTGTLSHIDEFFSIHFEWQKTRSHFPLNTFGFLSQYFSQYGIENHRYAVSPSTAFLNTF
jgi:hypothetical protein